MKPRILIPTEHPRHGARSPWITAPADVLTLFDECVIVDVRGEPRAARVYEVEFRVVDVPKPRWRRPIGRRTRVGHQRRIRATYQYAAE